MIGLGGAGLGSESVRIMPALVGHPALATKGRPLSVHTSGKSAGFMNELGHEVWAIHWCALVDPVTQTLPGEQLIDDQESAAGQSRMAS